MEETKRSSSLGASSGSLCLQAQLQLGHPLTLHIPPTWGLERGLPQISSRQGAWATAHQQESRMGQADQESGRDREFLAAKKEGKARLLAWELT